MSRRHLKENIKLRVDTETLDALKRMAEEGDRTVAAEMRRAIRAHINAANGDGIKSSESTA